MHGSPETSQIREVGRILGLKGNLASPYSNEAKLGESGYLDILRIARDVSVVSGGCLLVKGSLPSSWWHGRELFG